MAVIVATRLEAKGWRGARGVSARTGEVLADCRAVDGFLGGRVRADWRLVFWTVTVWEGAEVLGRFRARHAAVAATLDDVARASAMTAWHDDDPSVPTWHEVARRWPSVRPPSLGLSAPVAV